MEKLKVFVSYSHENPDWLATIGKMLKALQTSNVIDSFDDRLIAIGREWDATIKAKLDEADLVILLVTFDFLGSAYINQVEIERTLQRHRENRACLLPIIAEECDWEHQSWAIIDAWPTKDSKILPLAEWDNRNTALTQISKDIRKWAETWRPVRSSPDSAPAANPTTPPYRGLFAFESEDTADFFGRAALTDTLWNAVSANRLTLLTGGSGSGKSSLVNAGIIPRLDPESWCIVRIRPGETPVDNLARQLTLAMMPGADTFAVTDRAKEIAKRLAGEPTLLLDYAATYKHQHQKSLFIVIDQFEETYNLAKSTNREQHERLVDLLLAVAGAPDSSPVIALLAMRVDFQSKLQNDRPELVAALQDATVMMRRMTMPELTATIEGPARRRGVEVQLPLLTTLTREVDTNPDALPLLEVTLETLWNDRDGGPLTHSAYENLNGLAGALAARAEAALDSPQIDQEKLRRLFLELVKVDPKGGIDNVTRRPRTRTHLDNLDPGLWPLGQELASPAHRLLAIGRDETAADDTLDIIHEALFRRWDRFAGWIEQERDLLLFRQRLDGRRGEFRDNACNPEFFLRRLEVDQARDWQIRQPDALDPEQAAFTAASAAHWAEDAADNAARALWGRLELSLPQWRGIFPHEESALATLSGADTETRRRLLLFAVTDRDAARKLNRRPDLVLRAVLGLDPERAIDIAGAALAVSAEYNDLELGLSWLNVARHLAPLIPTYPPEIAARALELAAQNTETGGLEAVTHAIAAVVDKLDPKTASCTVDRVLDLAAKTTNSRAKEALAQAIVTVADKLDPETAGRTVDCALDLTAENTERFSIPIMAEAIAAVAGKLDADSASRTINRFLDLAAKTTNPHVLQALAQAIAAIARKLDSHIIRQAASRTVDRALDLAAKAIDSRSIPVLAEAIAAVADMLEPDTISKAASRIVDRALDLAAQNTETGGLEAATQAIAAVVDKLDPEATGRTVDRAFDLAAKTTDLNALQPLARAIAAGKLEPNTIRKAASRIVARALDLTAKTTDPDEFRVLAKAIAAFADKLHPETASRVVARAFDLAAKTTHLDGLQALAGAIAAVADKLDPDTIRNVASRIVDRALDLAVKTTYPNDLRALAKAIAFIADKLDPHIISDAANRTLDSALNLAPKNNDPFSFSILTEAIATVAPLLPQVPVLFVAIQLLNLPLGGETEITKTLLSSIAGTLCRPDLMNEFPERSFWAVMQHLAELKAANPDWHWLDLARPPLPVEELLAEFRHLCADPPAWPTAAPT